MNKTKHTVMYISRLQYWGKQNSGGLVISARNRRLLSDAFGENNILGIYVGTNGPQEGQHDSIKMFVEKNGFLKRYYHYSMGRFGFSKKLEDGIIAEIEKQRPEYLFFDGSWFGSISKKITCDSVKGVFVFYHNMEASVQFKEIVVPYFKPWRLIKYFCVKKNERIISNNAQYHLCLNNRDSQKLKDLYGKTADFLLPTTLLDKYSENNRIAAEGGMKNSTPVLLMVGIYFPPNVHGVKWFIRNVLQHLNCKLWIVGNGMEKLRLPNGIENVEIIGSVNDLGEYYYKADAVVEPIFVGDGMKTKTAEALMYGKTIFATDEALEGYDISENENIYRCNSVEDFVTNINKHFSYGAGKYNENVRELYLRNYEYGTMSSEFNDFISGIRE